MSFQSFLEELDRLYEEDTTKAEDVVEEETIDEVTEDPEVEIYDDADDDIIEIEDDTEDEEQAPADAQLVLECSNCGAIIIKAEVDVKVDSETDLANIEDECKYCEEADGYKIIGTFSPCAQDVSDDEDEVAEEGISDVDAPSADTKANNDDEQV